MHRLFDLLQLLRRHRHPAKGAMLAAELGISLRTLYRDIAVLQGMGAEIHGEPGLGYILKPSLLLPPMMFSQAEIEALALGLKWVAERTDDSMAVSAANAMAKVSAVLPSDLRRHLEDDALMIVPRWVGGINPRQSVDMALLRCALREEKKLELRYRDEKGAETVRIVWPVILGFFEATRIFVAWCELRQDFRSFRTDRIEDATLLSEKSPKRRKALHGEWRKTLLTETDSNSR